MLKSKSFLLIFIIIILISCKTINNNQEIKIIQDINFEFLGFNYLIIDNKTFPNDNGFYEQDYSFQFLFKNKDDNFLINYKIFDKNDNLILDRKKVRPIQKSFKEKTFVLEEKFSKVICYDKLKYNLIVEINGEKKEFNGEFVNDSVAYLDNCELGPIVSQYIDGKINVSIHCNFLVKNCESLTWIHIIPPSKNFYWNIPAEKITDGIQAVGDIYEKDKRYVQNGEYILQINLDKYGIVQDVFNIIDIYNNKKGNNYGLPIASFIGEDSSNIRIDLISKDMVEHMEIWLFIEIGGKLQKIGVSKYTNFSEIIVKKELKDMIYNDKGKRIKLISNKEYICKVYLFGKEINGIKYISISDPYKFKLKEYKFFPL